MNVTLSIDSNQLGETVVDLFKNLTEQQRQEVAVKVLEQWLAQPYDVERKAAKAEIARQARIRSVGGYSGKPYNDMTDEEVVKEDYTARGEFEKFVSSRELMVKEITSSALKHQLEVIGDRIKSDRQLNAVLDRTLKMIEQNFGAYVHDAMIAWFCTNMTTMATGIQSSLFQSSTMQERLDQLNRELTGR